MKFVPGKIYKEFVRYMPIICVDVVIVKKGEYLLVKRGQNPAKGQWWLPGGRLFKNESIVNAAIRKAQEETGFCCEFTEILGVAGTLFDESRYSGIGTHTVNIIALMKYKTGNVKLDNTLSDFCWHDRIIKGLHPYVENCLRKGGFR